MLIFCNFGNQKGKCETLLIMKSNLFISLLLFSGTLISLSACQNKPETTTDFLIKVDSIHCPDTVMANAKFDIVFYGTVGFNGCTSFKTFNQKFDDKNITIETWGTYENFNGTCPDVLVSLDGQKLSMTLPFAGTYKIKIKEPDNYLLYKFIKVKELSSSQK
jgi:hypothetical protein